MTTIDEQLNALTQFMPLEELRGRIAAAAAWLGRDAELLIPSTSIGADGVILSSIVLIAGDMIAEINLKGRYDNFDLMKLVVFNIRVTLDVHEVAAGEGVIAKYHIATVALQHTSSTGFGTLLTYAGVEPPNQWLNSVKAAFPVGRLAMPT
ncbi:hypothetical protein [Burkholderia sp. GbtcB21]|uniref:hypothetical protein n=1 Tax=Burkholderia sp. GbtcB21 TaxID=2824766 RepID=UPI001C30CF35|nr:hypothetical protein [Burkholderia sp. GbtcB21]